MNSSKLTILEPLFLMVPSLFRVGPWLIGGRDAVDGLEINFKSLEDFLIFSVYIRYKK